LALDQAETASSASSYAIIAKLATGGMADIFLARTASGAGVERYVVLKRVLRHRATDIKFVHMFLDEARLASQLQHPNIAQVFDTGKLGDSYFFTMEYVHGETVRELLHRAYAVSQKIPIGCALTIVAGAAAGLQHAHERVGLDGNPLGIVHRDVSPSNLMISYEGNVKLVDFGVAKASLQSIETQSGTVKGKIGYMAPEQCRGGRVDPRCDLFSLGIVMWELLTGERLFKRTTEFESMESIVIEPSPPPSSRRSEIPKSIDDITLKLLAKRPDDRYQSADELLEAIEMAAVGASVALSVPALKRFVRELFGQRPEPWLEMRVRDATPEIVTVTGLPMREENEDQLDRVLDLSNPSITVEGSGQQRSLAPPPTEPTRRHTATPITPPRPTPPPMPVVRAPTAPTTSGFETPIAPRVTPTGSNPEAVVPTTTSGTLAAAALSAQIPAVDAPNPWADPADHASELRPTTKWRPIAIGAGVFSVLVVIGVLAFGSGSRSDDHHTHVSAPSEPPTPTEKTVDPDPSDKPIDVAASFHDRKFDLVATACSDSEKVVAANRATCAMAACELHDADKARAWAADIVGADHDKVVSDCEAVGTRLVAEAEPTKPEPAKPKREPKKLEPKHNPKPKHTEEVKPLDSLPKLEPRHDPPRPPPHRDPPKPKCDRSDPMSCRR